MFGTILQSEIKCLWKKEVIKSALDFHWWLLHVKPGISKCFHRHASIRSCIFSRELELNSVITPFLCDVGGPPRLSIRELKKPRRRRRGQPRLKNVFKFYLRISRYPEIIKILLYGNGMCSLYVSLKNWLLSRKSEIILLSYEIGLINDNDFLLLYPSYVSQNSDLPFRTW